MEVSASTSSTMEQDEPWLDMECCFMDKLAMWARRASFCSRSFSQASKWDIKAVSGYRRNTSQYGLWMAMVFCKVSKAVGLGLRASSSGAILSTCLPPRRALRHCSVAVFNTSSLNPPSRAKTTFPWANCLSCKVSNAKQDVETE